VKSVDEQLDLIRRGAQIEPENELRKKLERSIRTDKPLRIKYGIDPTGIDVHLGHTVPLRKLRVFQELGHKAILILGNYTALVGDPSGRDKTRDRLTQEQVEANAQDYLKQVSKVIDIAQAEVRYNGEWFSKFQFLDVLSLMSKITVQRMLERDDFTKRLKKEEPIYLHECLYPLMQGRDSVEIHADVELGGSEQLFSLMVGRDLQRDAGQELQVCVTLPILRGLDGVRRMGKSLGNHVGVAQPPYDMLAKTMSIPDDLMRDWFELLTDRPQEEIVRLTNPELGNPRDAKITLGKDIVSFYYGAQAAEDAANEWRKRNSEKQDPAEIPEVVVAPSEAENGQIWICKLLKLVKFASGTNEARRHIQGGAVTVGPERQKITEPTANVALVDGLIVRVGNRRIVRVRLG
jgi:tyrosyl-tRNA synthetase